MAGGVSAMSGLAGAVLPRHSWLRWAWLAFVAALLVWVIVLLVRLNRDEGCV